MEGGENRDGSMNRDLEEKNWLVAFGEELPPNKLKNKGQYETPGGGSRGKSDSGGKTPRKIR